MDFVDTLSERVGQCDALIAIIGKTWVSSAYLDDARRLDDPNDFVRIEIEAALARKIRVIPVLVDGASMPRSDDLPDSLKKLTRRQGIEISHTRFNSDVERLTKALSLLDEELRQRSVAEGERAAREESERREAAEGVEKAEQVRRAAETERAARVERERREAAEGDRAKRARVEPENKTEVKQARPEAAAAVARALFEPANAAPEPPLGATELSAKAVRPSGLNKLIIASIVGALAFLAAALLTTHFKSPPNVSATTTGRSAEPSPPPPNAPSGAQVQHATSENCFGETNCFARIGPETQGVLPTSTAPSTPTTPQAQYAMGSNYEWGYGGVKLDYQQAIYWYRKAADQGYADAQDQVGWFYENGLGVNRDIDEARVWYQKAADQGNATAQTALNRLQSQQNPQEQTLTPTQENEMGDHYFYGRGVEQDYAKAMEWYRRAAHQGFANAQHNIGALYENGWGVAKDIDLAKVWYQRAAEQGDAFAEGALQRLQSQQNPSDQAVSPSPPPVTTPPEQSLTPAQEKEEGDRYFYGRDVEQDYAKAMEWYRKAGERGQADAQYNVGVLYENGWGVAKDIDQAKVWYQKAAEQGDGFAVLALTRLAPANTPASPAAQSVATTPTTVDRQLERAAIGQAEQSKVVAPAIRSTENAAATITGPLPPLLIVNSNQRPGRIYKLENGDLSVFYTRSDRSAYAGNLTLYSAAVSLDGTVYFVDANGDYVFQLDNSRVERPIYKHSTYVRHLGFDPSNHLYFSESTGAGGDGIIFRLDNGRAVPFYTVRLSEVDGFWAGTFAFDRSGSLWLSSGNRVPASLYKVVEGRPHKMFTTSSSIMGFCFTSDSEVLYSDQRQTIQRLQLPGFVPSLAYWSGMFGWASDVEVIYPRR